MSIPVRLIGLLIICILFGFSVWMCWSFYIDYKQMKEDLKNLQDNAQVTTAGVSSLDRQLTEKQQVEIVVKDRRSMLEQNFQELKREDQSVSEWADQPIPRRVRDLDYTPAKDGSADRTGWRERPDPTPSN